MDLPRESLDNRHKGIREDLLSCIRNRLPPPGNVYD